ncbi:MAG: hypothetical protein PHR20_02640 [Bacteroidales bacterium]|nr:hypothetical protein [Bacteroidales bacterium]
MEELNSVLQSIYGKVKVLIEENRDLKKSIYELENKITILNNQLSEEKDKQLKEKEIFKELMKEIDDCITIYSQKSTI